jgi:hypothetical protein
VHVFIQKKLSESKPILFIFLTEPFIRLLIHHWYKSKRFIISASLLAAVVVVAVILGSALGSRFTHNASGMTFNFSLQTKNKPKMSNT